MSEGVFEDFSNAELRPLRTGGLGRLRIFLSATVATSAFGLFICAYHVRPLADAKRTVVAAKVAPPAANPFGTVATSGLLRLDSVSPEELGRYGTLARNASHEQEPDFAPSDSYGGLAELQTSVTWASLALHPSIEPPSDETAPQEAPSVAAVAPVNPPLPPRKPADLHGAPATQTAVATPKSPAPETQASGGDAPGFFSRLFGGNGAATAPNHAVAYASAETTGIGRTFRDNAILRSLTPSAPPSALARYDKFTAVYDIEARTVYLPDGRRIEAHSGLAELKDDPKHVAVHARGATPPDTYELTMRESLFHGVQALRLTPTGAGDQFGRSGLLAHPYMLGPDGDSNGCVSLKDYDAFLQAYQSGQIKKLAVVAKLDS